MIETVPRDVRRLRVEVPPHEIEPLAVRYRDMPSTPVGGVDFDTLKQENPSRYAELVGLLEDVQCDRLIHPVLVRPNPNLRAARYQLISGWLAWSASLYFGKDRIPAIVCDADDLECLVLNFRINHNRVRPTRRESRRLAKLVANMLEKRESTSYQDVANALGCSPSWAFKLLKGNSALANGREGDEKRGRGRPSLTEFFVVSLIDPFGKESSVRLRACLEGGKVRFDRAEESSRWEQIDENEFRSALTDEIDRLCDWLSVWDGYFSSGKISSSVAGRRSALGAHH